MKRDHSYQVRLMNGPSWANVVAMRYILRLLTACTVYVTVESFPKLRFAYLDCLLTQLRPLYSYTMPVKSPSG